MDERLDSEIPHIKIRSVVDVQETRNAEQAVFASVAAN